MTNFIAVFCLLLIVLLLTQCQASPRPWPKLSWAKTLGHHSGEGIQRREKATARPEDTFIPITAPFENAFLPLSNIEAANITEFLHKQETLNLTNATIATSWDNVILNVELLPPNKSAILPFLNGQLSEAPARTAKASIKFGATDKPYIQEFIISPLPITSKTQVEPLIFIYNKEIPIQRVYDADEKALDEFIKDATNDNDAKEVTTALLGAVYEGADNGTLSVWGIDPLWFEDGSVVSWYQFGRKPTSSFDVETLLPQGLYFKVNITGRDPEGWKVLGWYYDGTFFDSIGDLRNAWKNGTIEVTNYETDQKWTHTDWTGEYLSFEDYNPPLPIKPDVPRYGFDSSQNYVEWMDFTFFVSFSRDVGLTLYDIHYKGERIIYELGLQEALAHYASSDPYQSGTSYLDSFYGFGPFSFELVRGIDCPSYATYLNSSYYTEEKIHIHPNSICLFEFEKDTPIQRHSTAKYVSATKNVVFILRTVCSIGNYDYQFTYEFYLDGSIQALVRASGYIQSAFWAHNEGYGFKVHDYISGSMHDHVLNYKLDLDVRGTKNSLLKTEFAPETTSYVWSQGYPRNTMGVKKSFITNEDDGKINWAPNSAASYSVVNKDAPNRYGEYPGWKIVPTTGSSVHAAIINSTNLGRSAAWATHPLYILKQKDSEPRSAYAYNALDPYDPVVDFAKFFDGESLEQEDLVIYFNLGTHHLPDTSDLPNTVFTLAQSGITISPQNYLLGDASRASKHQVRINHANGTSQVERFDTVEPAGLFNLTENQSRLEKYTGGYIVGVYPYDPEHPVWENEEEDQQQENPGPV